MSKAEKCFATSIHNTSANFGSESPSTHLSFLFINISWEESQIPNSILSLIFFWLRLLRQISQPSPHSSSGSLLKRGLIALQVQCLHNQINLLKYFNVPVDG